MRAGDGDLDLLPSAAAVSVLIVATYVNDGVHVFFGQPATTT
jgi:hypothetical protein